MTLDNRGMVPAHHVLSLLSGQEQIARATHYITDGLVDEAAELRHQLKREREEREALRKIFLESEGKQQGMVRLVARIEAELNSATPDNSDSLHNAVSNAIADIQNFNNPPF